MDLHSQKASPDKELGFYGGVIGALAPFFIFLIGVIFIALSGAPDEKGFWPILILALGVGLILSKNKKSYSEAVIDGMSERIVMIMITAWILASIIGVLMASTGFVEALTWMASQANLSNTGYIVSTFIICCIVSLSTGSSFATILICGPLLYPTGGLMGAHLPTLAGAVIAGATFGDFSAPISDTTIASALSQKANIGMTVKSRIKYIIPALFIAMFAFVISAQMHSNDSIDTSITISGDPSGIPMLLVPVLIIWLFLKECHLVHGLMYGLLFGVVIGLISGLLPIENLLSLDLENFVAKSFIIDGINRAVGISFFTILLMGLVGVVKASKIMERLVLFAEKNSQSLKQGEMWITGTVWTAVMMTTHSIVAILMTSDFSNDVGAKKGMSSVRRANILSLVVCIFPFLLPYFIPVILMSNMTSTGQEFDIASVGPLEVGLYNFMAWALLIITMVTLLFGFGRNDDNKSAINNGK